MTVSNERPHSEYLKDQAEKTTDDLLLRAVRMVYAELVKNFEDAFKKSETDFKSFIEKQFRKEAMTHHPDKGGDPEKFKEINNMKDILIDPARRDAFFEMKKNQVKADVYNEDARPSEVPVSDEDKKEKESAYQLLRPMEEAEGEFKNFYTDKIGKDADPIEHGYETYRSENEESGQKYVTFKFPDQKAADEFLDNLVKLGIAKDPAELRDQQAAEASRPSMRPSSPSNG